MADQRLKDLEADYRKERRIARRHERGEVWRRHTKRARFLAVKIRHRKEWIQAQKDHAFRPWMLNGCPNNIEPQVEEIIAVGVAKFGLVVTATTNGNHVWNSYHYPRNNPRRNGKGRGADLASGNYAKMRAFSVYVIAHRTKFDEGFGPPNTQFVKHGQLYNGAIPNHYNHNHVAPVYQATF